ncbi:hypothetical protein Tco_0889747 [Tanacetum coccineum]
MATRSPYILNSAKNRPSDSASQEGVPTGYNVSNLELLVMNMLDPDLRVLGILKILKIDCLNLVVHKTRATFQDKTTYVIVVDE